MDTQYREFESSQQDTHALLVPAFFELAVKNQTGSVYKKKDRAVGTVRSRFSTVNATGKIVTVDRICL